MSGHFVLTKRQANALERLMDVFYAKSCQSTAVTGEFLLILGGVRQAVKDRQYLEQYQIDVLIWVIELMFSQFEDDDVDPLLEQAYCKLTGYWFEGFEPWHERSKVLTEKGKIDEWRTSKS